MSKSIHPKTMETIFHNNEKKVGKYILKEKIGQGQFGMVWKAIDSETKKIYAIKKIEIKQLEKIPKLYDLFKTEISIMHEINHENIIHLYDFLKSKKNFYLVINFCNQGDLQQYLQKQKKKYLPEKKAVYFLKQIMNGFLELRKKKILHRDIKLQNIFINNEKIIIGDFGLSKKGVERATSLVGTPLTMAYEILIENSSYNYKADLWSIGIVYYNLLFGVTPFFAFTQKELIFDIKKKLGNLNFVRNDGSSISQESKDLINSLLQEDPKKRLGWIDFFCHPLFENFKSEWDYSKVMNEFDEIVKSVKEVENCFSYNKDLFLTKKNSNVNFEDYENFLSDNELISINKDNILNPKKVDVFYDNGDNNSEAILFQKMEQEIKFRFQHEKNKILYLIYTVKKIERNLENKNFIKIKNFLLKICVYLLKKALVINNRNIIHINIKSNIFDFNEYYFSIIKNSENFENLIKIFQNDDLKIKNFLELIIDIIYKNNFSYDKNIIELYNPDLNRINKFINKNLLCIRFFFSIDNLEDSILKNIFLCIFNCINLDDSFPYFLDMNSKKKFEWEKYLDDLENFKAPVLKLKSIFLKN